MRFGILVATLTAFVTLPFAQAQLSDEQFGKMMQKYLESEAGKDAVGGAAQKYFEGMRNKAREDMEKQQAAELEKQFVSPVKIDIGNSPVRGPANAKITIVEFSDFECPFCARGMQTMEEVMKAYPNDVKVVFKNLPLPFHKNAAPAAKAALAAGKQGKFWEMHDALFGNQRGLSDAFYLETATKLGLNIEKFKTDMASPELDKDLEADKKIAEANGISGTPGFFVNGVAVRGAYPVDHFKKIIDRWLAAGGAAAPAAKQG